MQRVAVLPPLDDDPGARRRGGALRGLLPWLATLVFVIAGVGAVFQGCVLHEAGLLTWHFSGVFIRAPLAGLLLPTLRPPLAVLYAPLAPLGFRAFAIAHVLVAAAAIPLSAAIARELGQRCFVIPALAIACSPLLLVGAAAGFADSDVAVGLLLGLYLLWVAERRVAAGLVLGALLLVRIEVAPFVLAIVGQRLWARDGKALAIGVAALPLAFVLLGAVYHRDGLWLLHRPPASLLPTTGTRGLTAAAWGLLGLTPAIGLLSSLRPRTLVAGERGLAVGLLLFVLLEVWLGGPMQELLVGLPAAALLVGRGCDEIGRGGAGRGGGLVAALILVACAGLIPFVADDRLGLALLVAAVVAWSASLALTRLGWSRAALLSWLVPAAVVGPMLPQHAELLPQYAELLPPRAVTLDAVAGWWRNRGPDPDDEVAVVTTIGVASTWLARAGVIARPDRVRTLLSRDVAASFDAALDRGVGQDRAVLAAMDGPLFGRPILHERDPLDWPEGTIVIVALDDRLAETIDVARWRRYLEIEVDGAPGWVLIGRVHHSPEAEAEAAPPAYLPAARDLLGGLDRGDAFRDGNGWIVDRVEGPLEDGRVRVVAIRDGQRLSLWLRPRGADGRRPAVQTARWDIFFDRPEPAQPRLGPGELPALVHDVAARVRAHEG